MLDFNAKMGDFEVPETWSVGMSVPPNTSHVCLSGAAVCGGRIATSLPSFFSFHDTDHINACIGLDISLLLRL